MLKWRVHQCNALHYLAVDEVENPNWCGAHLDHGVLTALMPAYYFRNGEEVDELEEAGLYIMPSHGVQRSLE
jgi:hypothetical protein